MSLYLQFADLLDYPDRCLPQHVKECGEKLEDALPEAAKLVESFQRSQQELGITRLQEAYTSAFDLQPECTLNLGYHLFGEDQRRGLFLAKLKDFYGEAGIDTKNELPDHLSLLLRYVAMRPQKEESRAIVADCLLPAISKIAQGMKEKPGPYAPLVTALLLWLEREFVSETVSNEMESHAEPRFAS